jgi:hypothetical protein
MKQSKICEQCSQPFFKPITTSKKIWDKAKYCSRKCTGLANAEAFVKRCAHKKGTPTWNKGLKGVTVGWGKGEKRPEMSGEAHHNWKGEKAGYSAAHMWVKMNKTKPDHCHHCGKKGNGYQIHWSNIDHQYKRNLDDYVALCASCHKKYDLENGLCEH